MLRCAIASGLVGEPLAGTAPVARRWLAVEHHGPWGRDANTDAGAELSELAVRAAAAGARLALIRPPRRRGAKPGQRVFLADTTPGRTALTTLTATPSELLELDLGAATLPGEPVAAPLLLVCAHAQRDRCCAIDGRALATELHGQQLPVWECSHLGGHRFAPTAAVLPTGYVYGRLDVGAALGLMKAAGAGEVEPAGCRGRSTWDQAGQVAELAVRDRTGERRADALAVHGPDPDGVLVEHVDGRRWRVTVAPVVLPEQRPSSCGGPDQQVKAVVATGVAAL